MQYHRTPYVASIRPSLPVIAMFILLSSLLSGCSDAGKGGEKKREGSSSSGTKPGDVAAHGSSKGIAMYDLKDPDPPSFPLPSKLREISGIAFTADGRLFGHGDERGTVFQIDTTSGEVIKRFYPGPNGVKGDFEDIAIIGSDFYMVTSSGEIHAFKEGENEAEVPFSVYRTPLTAAQDVEGLCHDPATNALLLVCKGDPGKGYNGHKAVYSFSLERNMLDPEPRFLLPLNDLLHLSKEEKFDPSAMALNRRTGTFFLLTSSGHALAEIDSSGSILGGASLRKSLHSQPEGLAFTSGMTLLISDEGGDGTARLTSYRVK